MKGPIETFLFESYDASRTYVDATHRNLSRGSANQIISGNGKAQAFKGLTAIPALLGSRYLTNAGNGYAGLGSFADTTVKGSAFRILSAMFFIGNGSLYFNGVSLGASASSILQLQLLSSGTFGGVTYQAGLSQPSAPTLATLSTLGVGYTGKLKNGTYSAKVIKIRSATGARSLASLVSVTISATESAGIGQSARITLSAIGANGADRWGIYVSARNFGSTGPHYLLREIDEASLVTVDGVPRSYEIEWTDGDLVGQPLAPIDSFPPPAAMFAGVLGDVVFLAGAYGDVTTGVTAASPGSTIVQSLPLHPEEFPPDFTLFASEPPTALLRGGDGFYYHIGKSSMGVISYIGGEPALSYQNMWTNTGCAYPHNAVTGTGGKLYMKSGKSLVRIGADGEPETAWAAPVADDIAVLDDAGTVLGWDTDSHSLIVANNNKLWVYNEQKDAWGAPITVTGLGRITAAVTQSNSLIVSAENGAALTLYTYNIGTGSLMSSQTDWHFAEDIENVCEIDVIMRADNTATTVRIDIYGDEDETTPIITDTLAVRRVGLSSLTPWRGNLPVRSFAIKVTHQTTGSEAGFEIIRVQGYRRGIVE